VKIWFSILETKSLHGASFTPFKQLRQPIDAFIESYNPHAKPVASTKVHQNASNDVSPINDFGY
jgi:hypothetical protein